jgi:hypothetical protein
MVVGENRTMTKMTGQDFFNKLDRINEFCPGNRIYREEAVKSIIMQMIAYAEARYKDGYHSRDREIEQRRHKWG